MCVCVHVCNTYAVKTLLMDYISMFYDEKLLPKFDIQLTFLLTPSE